MSEIIPDYQGLLAEIQLPNPAAGMPLVYRPPALNRHLVLSLSFYLTTDANVAARRIWIATDFFGHIHQTVFSNVTQAATLVHRYVFCTTHTLSNMAIGFLLASAVHTFPIGHTYFLSPRMDININVDQIQVGDQISDVWLHSMLWQSN